jgi:diketogulonate reductase-like aldo/keto reductase
VHVVIPILSLRRLYSPHPVAQSAKNWRAVEASTEYIPKSSDVDHAIEIAGAGDLELTGMQIERIDKAFPPGPVPLELPTI